MCICIHIFVLLIRSRAQKRRAARNAGRSPRGVQQGGEAAGHKNEVIYLHLSLSLSPYIYI